jgi:CubicO group peptidase (beta-lactamase class C family)
MWRYLAILGLVCLTAAALSQDGPQSGGIEAFLDRAVPRAAAPGLAYALVENGGLQQGQRGERVAGSGLPVTEDTPFALGSISKSFTALAIMQQVEAGRIGLDRGIGEYLDEFGGRPGGAITIRQLLSHTSGYSTLQGNSSHTDRTGGADELAERVRQLAMTAPAGEAGSRWQYSNANYLILGRLVETVSGLEFGDYIETRILEPLGMEDSFVADGEAHAAMAIGHTPWFGGRRPVADRRTVRGMAPAGGVMASAADMARYLTMMMNGEDDLISADHKTMMLRPASAASPHYGFGWFLDAGGDAAYHTGLTPGVETIAVLSRSGRRGGVVLVNANSGMGFGVTGDILAGVAALALGDTPQNGGNHLGAKSLYLMLLVLPVLFLAGIATAWIRRDGLRAKSGVFGAFSLFFPLVATLAMAWVFVDLVPRLFGAPLATFKLYQPDMTILLVASSVCGVGFAVFRLAVAYSGRR